MHWFGQIQIIILKSWFGTRLTCEVPWLFVEPAAQPACALGWCQTQRAPGISMAMENLNSPHTLT